MESLLLENLARTQAFDAAVRKQNQFDRIASRFTGAILFDQDEGARAVQIGKLQTEVVAYFDRQVQPEARRLGVQAAHAVLVKLKDTGAADPDLNDPLLRRRVLLDDKLRPAERLRIFQAIVREKGGTLENRLTAFWLEPGTRAKQKLDYLRALHHEMELRRAAYEQQLADFYAGGTTKRPATPQLDYMSRFTREVKLGALEQARRAGTEAETAHFVSKGHKILAWVTVNAAEACRDCRGRQGMMGDLAFWETTGRPGSGRTICGTRCFCMLVPAKTLTAFPKLQAGLDAPVPDESASAASAADQAKLAKALAQSQAKLKAPPPPFPVAAKDLDRLRELRNLGGSTGAMLVEDEFGQKFVLKRGGSAGHLREEFYAENAYRALGVDVPDSRLYDAESGPVKLAKFIEGKALKQLQGEARQQAEAKLRDGFAADALMGDWDAVGLERDNVLVAGDGRVWRLDVGGSLRYRAQGGLKTDAQWNGYPVDLFTLRDKKINEQMAAVHGPLTHRQVMQQVEALGAKREALLAALPEELRPVMAKRLGEATRLSGTSKTLLADQWKEDYVERFSRHQLGIRQAGIVDRLPRALRHQGDTSHTTVYDQNGKPWDELRGENNTHAKIAAYIDKAGGAYGVISGWASNHSGSSWSSESKAIKAFLAEVRDVPETSYYWHGGVDSGRANLDAQRKSWGKEKYAQSVAAYHAFNYEFLQAVDFHHNDRAAGTVKLVRTESKSTMQSHGFKRGDKGIVFPRGAAESTSVFKTVRVSGTESTVIDVPHHRVLGTYFHQREVHSRHGTHSGLFMSDSENEFVAMLDGLKTDYVLFDDEAAKKSTPPAPGPEPDKASGAFAATPTTGPGATWAGYQQFKKDTGYGGTFKQYQKKAGYLSPSL